MKMLNRLLALTLAALLCISCAAAQSPEDVMATVNGTPITRSTFDTYLNNVTSYYAYYGYDVTMEENASYLRFLTLDTLVQMALMDQKIIELGVTLTEEERAAAESEGRALWVEDVSSALGYYGVTASSTEEQRAAALMQALAELEALGYTEQQYIDESVENALYIKLETLMAQDASVTDGDVEALYNSLVEEDRQAYAHDAAAYESAQQMNAFALQYGMTEYYQALWYIPVGYRSMTYICLPVEEALLTGWADLEATYEEQQGTLEEGMALTGEIVTAEEVENAKLAALASVQPLVDEINGKLAEGIPFAELMTQYGVNAGLPMTEELAAGLPVHMDSILYPAGFRDAAFALEVVGDVSEPFLTDSGVYMLCYAGELEGGPMPLTEDLRAELHAQLLESAQAKMYYATMDAWLAEAEIIYSDEAAAFMTN